MAEAGISVVALDEDTRRLVVYALNLAEERLRRDGLRPPPTLNELRDALSGTASDGQETPTFDSGETASDDGWMNRAQAAVFVSLSMRTLARRTADGSIPSTKVGARRLYKRSDLEGL